MNAVASGVAGVVATLVLLRGCAPTLAHPVLARANYRDHVLPTAAGFVLVVAVVAVDGARTLLGIAGVGDAPTAPARLLLLATVVVFGLLGLVDDLLGDGADRGLRGHLRAAVTGRFSTGFLKLGCGAAAALVLAGSVGDARPARVLLDAGLIALAANMGNLFDRAPGRVIKWSLVAYAPLAVVAGAAAVGVALAVVAGAAVALAWGDLHERFMLGDTGANALGGALGMATVLEASPRVRDVVVVVLLALTLVSEVVSFSAVIEAVPPLRWFDHLGRRGPDGAP